MKQIADVIFGLGFGDEGKGQTVCHTANERYEQTGIVPVVVRYSGGCQNSHNVVWEFSSNSFIREYHHEHSQIGAIGPLAFESQTYTWKTVPFDAQTLIREAITLYNVQDCPFWGRPVVSLAKLLSGQHIHEDCLWMFSPIHEYVSKMRDTQVKHGSTGRGIFEVNKFAELFPDKALYMKDMLTLLTSTDSAELEKIYTKAALFVDWVLGGMEVANGSHVLKTKNDKYERLQTVNVVELLNSFKGWVHDFLDDSEYTAFINSVVSESVMLAKLREKPCMVFEGGQGVMLDMDFGFFPNVTFSKAVPVTAQHILKLLDVPETNINYIGVTRYYGTRHGAGYLPFEINQDNDNYKVFQGAEKHNTVTFAGAMRYGKLSADNLMYALQAVKNSGINMSRIHWTHADTIAKTKAAVNIINPDIATNMANMASINLQNDVKRRGSVTDWVNLVQGNIKSKAVTTDSFDTLHKLVGLPKSEGCRVEQFK